MSAFGGLQKDEKTQQALVGLGSAGLLAAAVALPGYFPKINITIKCLKQKWEKRRERFRQYFQPRSSRGREGACQLRPSSNRVIQLSFVQPFSCFISVCPFVATYGENSHIDLSSRCKKKRSFFNLLCVWIYWDIGTVIKYTRCSFILILQSSLYLKQIKKNLVSWEAGHRQSSGEHSDCTSLFLACGSTYRPQYNTIQYNEMQCTALHCTALHCTTLHYTTLHYTTTLLILHGNYNLCLRCPN